MQSTGSFPTLIRTIRCRVKAKAAKYVCIFLVLVGALVQLYPIRSLNPCHVSLQGANVAVLMYGQARTLNRTHCSITEHIITPLLRASHKVHVFVHGELDGDSWQYHAYLDQLSQSGVRYQIDMRGLSGAAPQCSMALDEKYETRIGRVVKEGASYGAELLVQLKYRESVNSLRKKFEETEGIAFDAIILARPDVVYTSSLPPLCVLDDNIVQAPPWQPYGGINDRFLVARSGPAVDHYLGLYTGLCDKGFVTRLPRRWWKGMNAERIYAWWMRQGGFQVETSLMKKFVFYRLRRSATLAESPDSDFGQHKGATIFNSKYNPSSVPWSSVLKNLTLCPQLTAS